MLCIPLRSALPSHPGASAKHPGGTGQHGVTSHRLGEALNGWEAGKVKDTASNTACKWILIMGLLLIGDMSRQRGWERGRPTGPCRAPQVHHLVFTPTSSLLLTLHLSLSELRGMLLHANNACEHVYVSPLLFW